MRGCGLDGGTAGWQESGRAEVAGTHARGGPGWRKAAALAAHRDRRDVLGFSPMARPAYPVVSHSPHDFEVM
jgi:hypothetical protein